MLCTCETQGALQGTLQWSPGAGAESTDCTPAVFICNFYYLFGFQFGVILPFSSQQISQVHEMFTMLAMRWMEKRIYTTKSVHTLTKKAILGGE